MFRIGSNQSASSDSAKKATSRATNDRLCGLCESMKKKITAGNIKRAINPKTLSTEENTNG